jgi:hypothetical protein
VFENRFAETPRVMGSLRLLTTYQAIEPPWPAAKVISPVRSSIVSVTVAGALVSRDERQSLSIHQMLRSEADAELGPRQSEARTKKLKRRNQALGG